MVERQVAGVDLKCGKWLSWVAVTGWCDRPWLCDEPLSGDPTVKLPPVQGTPVNEAEDSAEVLTTLDVHAET
jgi:hypothetical protein